jgi:hypothetical protein
VYLVEGDCRTQSGLPSTLSLTTAVEETRASGFWVHETASREESARFIIDVHRALEARTAGQPVVGRTWAEYKSQCARSGPSTVGEVFVAMLRQIPGVSAPVAAAVQTAYPTPRVLVQAYLSDRLPDAEAEWKRRATLLSNIKVGLKKIGPALSARIARVFSMQAYVVSEAAAAAEGGGLASQQQHAGSG